MPFVRPTNSACDTDIVKLWSGSDAPPTSLPSQATVGDALVITWQEKVAHGARSPTY